MIFEVANPNYHGVPAPIACPADRSRQSFIVYYHTVGIDGKLDVAPHSSIFAPNFYRENRTLRSFARELTPPVLLKAAKKLVTFWKTTPTRSPWPRQRTPEGHANTCAVATPTRSPWPRPSAWPLSAPSPAQPGETLVSGWRPARQACRRWS